MSGLILLPFRFTLSSLPVHQSIVMQTLSPLLSLITSWTTVLRVPASVLLPALSCQTLIVFSSNILVVVMQPFLSIPFFGFARMVLSLCMHGFYRVFVLPFHPPPSLVTPCMLVVQCLWLWLVCCPLRFRPLGIGPLLLGSATLGKILPFCKCSSFMAGQFTILLSPLCNCSFFLSFFSFL